MTYTTPVFSTLNTEGVDLSTAFTLSTSTPEYPGAPYALGTEVIGSNDGRWVYCTAGGAVTAGDVVCVTKAFSINSITSTIAATSFGLRVGTAMATMTTGQYAWVQTQGVNTSPGVNVIAGVAPNVLLYTTATAGRLSSALTTGVSSTIAGIVTTTTSAATAGTYPGVMTSPVVSTAN